MELSNMQIDLNWRTIAWNQFVRIHIHIYIQIRKCKMENSMHPLMLIIFDSYHHHHHRNLTGRKMRACYEWPTHHNKLAPPIYCDSMENYKRDCNYMHETYWFGILDFCPLWIRLLRIETNVFWMKLLFHCMTCVWHPRFKYIILSTNQHNVNSSNATLNWKCERNTIANAHGFACTQFIDRKQLNHVHPIALTHVHWYRSAHYLTHSINFARIHVHHPNTTKLIMKSIY